MASIFLSVNFYRTIEPVFLCFSYIDSSLFEYLRLMDFVLFSGKFFDFDCLIDFVAENASLFSKTSNGLVSLRSDNYNFVFKYLKLSFYCLVLSFVPEFLSTSISLFSNNNLNSLLIWKNRFHFWLSQLFWKINLYK